jgi:hypothetical protein
MRTGKIARLPREIRDQLNQRLLNGQPGQRLLAWLNALPEVQRILAADFDGSPINAPNLSHWKAGGYEEDWLTRRETLEQARELAAATDGKLTDHLATVLAARYAAALAEWNGEPDEKFERKLRILRSMYVPGHRQTAPKRSQCRPSELGGETAERRRGKRGIGNIDLLQRLGLHSACA